MTHDTHAPFLVAEGWGCPLEELAGDCRRSSGEGDALALLVLVPVVAAAAAAAAAAASSAFLRF